MRKFLARHHIIVLTFGGIIGGCIYTKNWAPFYIMLAVCFLVSVAIYTVTFVVNKGVKVVVIERKSEYVHENRLYEEEHEHETMH